MGMEKQMIEQAEEELEILEAQHPNRFEYLKIELKSLIFLLHSQNITLSNDNNFNKSYNFLSSSPNSILLPASSTATTQASSSNKKRKKTTSEMQRTEQPPPPPPPPPKQKIRRADWDESFCSNRRDGVEDAIEKARACLLKIQQFKTNFY